MLFRTPFTLNSAEQNKINEAAGGGDSYSHDEIQNLQRQKMYEKIITYKDNLTFERKKHRSSSVLSNDSDLSQDSWKEPSEDAKFVLSSLVRANKGDRLTAKEFLLSDWLPRKENQVEELY